MLVPFYSSSASMFSAPISFRYWTIGALLLWYDKARLRGLCPLPARPVRIFLSAPCSIRSRTASTCPLRTDSWIGCQPFSSGRCSSLLSLAAICCSRSMSPTDAAMCGSRIFECCLGADGAGLFHPPGFCRAQWSNQGEFSCRYGG